MYHTLIRGYLSNSKKKNTKSKFGVILFIALTCLLVSGCTQTEAEDENKDLVQGFLGYELNTPNEDAMLLEFNDLEGQEKNGAYSSEYNTYLEETYGPYFTDSGYDRLLSNAQASMFHEAANKYDYQTTVTKIEMEQNKDTPTNYNFTVYIDYEKNGHKKMNTEITGIAILRDEGIEKISFLGNEEMLRTLTQGE